MFGIGTTEILVILVVALIVIGPESLPKVAKTIGKTLGEFRKVSTEFQRTLNTEIALEEHAQRKKEAEEELFGDKNKEETTTTENSEKKDTKDTQNSENQSEKNKSDKEAA